MNEQRVTKDQAIRLKAAGFDWPTTDSYFEDSPHYKNMGWANWNQSSYYISAPTISDATRWLRDVKGWHVVALPVNLWQQWRVCIYYESINGVPQKHRLPETRIDKDTHDLAISAGIDEVLNMLEKEASNG